jgi:hypothetical protein
MNERMRQMCQSCIGCGKCNGEVRPMLSVGVCPMCKHENPETALTCSNCGGFLPLAPGAPSSSRKRSYFYN